MATATGWARVNELRAELDAIYATQDANRFANGTPEFAALVERLVAAKLAYTAAITAAWAKA